MSRSRKKVPISSVTGARSNKIFKQIEHRRERRRVKTEIASGRLDRIPHPKQYGNEWDSPRDGKVYCGEMRWGHCYYMPYLTPEQIEKDKKENIESYKKLMRK